jgi:hypothetical protein
MASCVWTGRLETCYGGLWKHIGDPPVLVCAVMIVTLGSTVALLRSADIVVYVARVIVCVIMRVLAVGMTMSSKNQEPNQIRRKSQASDNQNKLRVRNLRGVEQSSERFQDNRDAEGDEENSVEEGT